MRTRWPRVATTLVLTAVLCLATSGPVAARAARARVLQVTGYADDWTPPSTIDAQARALSLVGVDGVDVVADGDAITLPNSGALRLLATAHADGIGATLLVDNFDGSAPGMSTAVATRLLTSAPHRARVVAALVRLVRTQGWNGITVDLEALAPRDAAGLVGFVAAIRRHLPRHDQVAVDVSATTSLPVYLADGYHLRGLGRVADVVLMAYDEDGPWSGPGPIGGLPWQRGSIAAVRRLVPSSHLILGVAAYGYSWPRGARVHDGTAMTDAQARRLAKASHRAPRWIPSQGEWTVRLRDGTVLWWSDARSYRLRWRLAERDRLVGLAVWQLASADQLPAR